MIPLLLVGALSLSPAQADRGDSGADAPSSLCTDSDGWNKDGRTITGKIDDIRTKAKAVTACSMLPAVADGLQRFYRTNMFDARRKFCSDETQAEAAYTALSQQNTAASTGQLCGPLTQQLANVTDAKTKLQALQKELQGLIDEQNKRRKKLDQDAKALIGQNCSKNLNCQQNPIGVTGRNGSAANDIQMLGQCASLNGVSNASLEFWSAPVSDRLSAFHGEAKSVQARLVSVGDMETKLNANLKQQGCGSLGMSPESAKAALDAKNSATATTAGTAAGAVPDSSVAGAVAADRSGVANAADMSKCYSGACSSDQVKAQQTAINKYISENNLPVQPIAVDGIAGTQTANAWRAVDQSMQSSNTYLPMTGAEQKTMNTSSYKTWDPTSQVDSATGYVIFQKGTNNSNVMKYFQN